MQLLMAYKFLKSKHNTGFINIISKISILGIILGVGILITVLSVMNGFEKELRQKILGFTSHVTIYPRNNSFVDYSNLFEQLKVNKDVIGYSPYVQKEILISSNTSTTNAYFRAIDPKLEQSVGIVNESIIFGSFNNLDISKNNIVLGNGVANKLLVRIGDEVEILTQFTSSESKKPFQFKNKYIVSGIFDVGLYEYNNAYVFIDLNNFFKILEQNNKRNIFVDAVSVKLHDALIANEFSLNFNNTNNKFFSQDWTKTHTSLFSAINNEKRVMFIILMLIVAVAAFNIISSLLMLVINKQKDIAILMTLGATKMNIIKIFVLQGLFLGLLGTIFGIIFGLLLSVNIDAIITTIESVFNLNLMPAEIYHLEKIPSIINYNDVIWIGLFTFILTLLSTIYPAIKAAEIRPAAVFRGEN